MTTNINIFNKSFIFILFILTNFTLSSCSNQTKVTCNQIQTIITGLNKKIEPVLNSNDIAEIVAITQEFDMTSERLLAIETDDNFLVQSTQNLALIYEEYANVTRNFLQAFTTKNTEDAIASKQTINQLFTKQEQLVTEINNYCMTPSEF